MQVVGIVVLCLVQYVLAKSVDSKDLKDLEHTVVTSSALEVLATTQPPTSTESLSRYEKGLEDYDEAMENAKKARQGRGMSDYEYDDHHDDHHHVEEMKPVEQQKAVKTDPWAGYYDFIINEGSFKFWAVFQLGTALLLAYSAFAAIYYAKFNPITSDYDYYDDFFFRSNGRSSGRSASSGGSSSSSWFGLDSQTFQRIITAITSKKYT